MKYAVILVLAALLGVLAPAHAGTSTSTQSLTGATTLGSLGGQPLDSDLTCVAGLATTGVINRTGTGTCATVSVAPGTGTLPIYLYNVNTSAVRNSVNAAGDATFAALASVSIPAMGANDTLCVRATFSYSNSASTKNLIIRFGGTNFQALSATTTAHARNEICIGNRNSTSSQIADAGNSSGSGGWSLGTGTLITGSINTSVPTTLDIGGNWSAAANAENITLQRYTVWLIRG